MCRGGGSGEVGIVMSKWLGWSLGAIVLMGSVLYVVMDHAACVDTEAVVLHNWQDYGWWTLRAGYVVNEGGLHSGDAVRILHGHLSTVLWPYHLVTLLTGSLSAAYGLVYLAFLILSLLAFWWAFADKRSALLWGFALACSPAFLRSFLDVDPVSHGLLYTAVLFPVGLRLLSGATTTRPRMAAALVLLMCVLSLDWPNAMALAIWAPLFLMLHGAHLNWRRAFWLLLPLGLFSAALMVLMILHKQQGLVSLSFLAKHYTAGADVHAGDFGVAWLVAIKRHGMASGIGWLPLWGLWLVALFRRPSLSGSAWWLCLLPVGLSLLLLLVLKDYFAAHQWLVAPLVANGLTAAVWGLDFLRNRQRQTGTDAHRGWWWPLPLMLAYGLVFALFFRMNNADKTLTHELLARHTPRQAVILLYPYDHTKDGKPLEIAKRASLEFDRLVEPYEPGKGAQVTAGGRPCFVLAKAPLPKGELVARAEVAHGFLDRVSGRVLDVYRQKISQRRKGDSSEWSGWLYLYRESNNQQ